MTSNNNNNKDRKGKRKMKISNKTTLFIQPFQEDDLYYE